MRIEAPALAHLSYCTNIHPGESWPEVRHNLETHVPRVKALVCPDRPFGLGLRLGGAAIEALEDPGARESLQALLDRHDLYVFTINGFPYGPFHGTSVKENVYRPDWSEALRLEYTRKLVELLARVLPPGVEGSISTVPGCFRPLGAQEMRTKAIAQNLLACTAELWQRAESSGIRIVLAIEPKPHCLLERIDETVTFYEDMLLRGPAFEAFIRATGLRATAAEDAIRRHLGVCLDTCHAAVEFEDPVGVVEQLRRAELRIAKVQVTTGLRISRPQAAQMEPLHEYAEGVYLHQTVVREGDAFQRFLDLSQALEAYDRGEILGDEWRIHFHVPVFCEDIEPFENTQAFLRPCLDALVSAQATQHYEVETYTWDVLPIRHRREAVEESIAREMTWTLKRLTQTP